MSRSKFSDALAAAKNKGKASIRGEEATPKRGAGREMTPVKGSETQEKPPEQPTGELPRRGPGRPSGKRSDPDFQPTTAYIRKATYRSVRRALMDEGEDLGQEREYSELIEELLSGWLASRT